MARDRRISVDASEIQDDIEELQGLEPVLAELPLAKAIAYFAKRGIVAERDRLGNRTEPAAAGQGEVATAARAGLVNFLQLVAKGECPPDDELIITAESLGIDPALFVELCPKVTEKEGAANGI